MLPAHFGNGFTLDLTFAIDQMRRVKGYLKMLKLISWRGELMEGMPYTYRSMRETGDKNETMCCTCSPCNLFRVSNCRGNAEEIASSLQDLGSMQNVSQELQKRIAEGDAALRHAGSSFVAGLEQLQELNRVANAVTVSCQVHCILLQLPYPAH